MQWTRVCVLELCEHVGFCIVSPDVQNEEIATCRLEIATCRLEITSCRLEGQIGVERFGASSSDYLEGEEEDG